MAADDLCEIEVILIEQEVWQSPAKDRVVSVVQGDAVLVDVRKQIVCS